MPFEGSVALVALPEVSLGSPNAHDMRGSTTKRNTARTGPEHRNVMRPTAATVTASSPSGECGQGRSYQSKKRDD